MDDYDREIHWSLAYSQRYTAMATVHPGHYGGPVVVWNIVRTLRGAGTLWELVESGSPWNAAETIALSSNDEAGVVALMNLAEGRLRMYREGKLPKVGASKRPMEIVADEGAPDDGI